MHRNESPNKTPKDDRPTLSPTVVGAMIGFLFALLWVIFGFWNLLFIVLMSALGAFIGFRYFRDRETLKKFIDKILPPGKFR
ncbi:MAG: DUF2273 domain-containing protein [Saccharofermentanales bacterium]|jgi:uncharacterized membrane protein